MSLFQFIYRSLVYFRRRHLALLAGTMLATAVLTGALIVGDSVRFSLRKLAETRLGNIRYSLITGGRFVRSDLATELSGSLNTPTSAVLMLQGIGINPENKTRINRMQVAGIDSSFWNFAENILPTPGAGEAVLSENAASALGLKIGDALLLRVEQTGLIPVNAPFSPENSPAIAFRLKIIALANDASLGRFSLKSNQLAPFTVFLNREMLTEKLNLSGLCNLILFGENSSKDLTAAKISKIFGDVWKPLDAGLMIKELPDSGKFELVSNRVFIDKPVSNVIENLEIPHQNILTYLVNSFHAEKNSTPYSFIFAAHPDMIPGLLNHGDIVINEWLAMDLDVKPGDSISLDYYVIAPLRKLIEKTRDFRVSAIIPTSGSFTDSTLMPDFPGLSDAGNCRDWNTGVPIDLKLIRDKDEKYWDTYRGTPKAIIGLSAGLEMWSNPFGEYTAIRFKNSDLHPDTLLKSIMHNLHPEDLGMMILPVYSEGLSSAGNGVDFGQLFLALSFFIIIAAVLLIILIYSLNINSRNTETALLSGLGIPNSLILRIRVAESFVVVVAGSILGAIAGIFYNYLLVKALNTVWLGAMQTSMLVVHIRWTSLFAGAGTGFILSFLTIIIISSRKLKQQVSLLIRENIQTSMGKSGRLSHLNVYISLAGILSAVVLTGYSFFTGAYEDPALFMSAGALFLTGSIFGVSWLLVKMQDSRDYSRLGIIQLALKNAGRGRGRSLAVVLVLAIGVFSIILTGAYRKTYTGTENEKTSGTGGFLFWAETSLPIPADLNDSIVQEKYLVSNAAFSPEIHFEQFHSLEGDDASCLNLNQVIRPRILGVNPESFNRRGAFSFISLLDESARKEPWLQLKRSLGKNIIPAFADQSVIQYGLKKSLGDTLLYLNECGEKIKLLLVGGLENSIFQGNILIDDTKFIEQFPSAGGSHVLLIDAPGSEEANIAETMNYSFTDYGIELSKASVRLAVFNSVENTYLSVFMILGGLGLIIGTFGLAIVFFRNILERKHEFAILSALGIKNNQIIRLIMTENIFLFLSGLSCGIFAAFISILPSILSPGFHTQILPILIILVLVVASGIFWIWIPARNAIRKIKPEALRNE